MTITQAEHVARAVASRTAGGTDAQHAAYYAAIATALIAQQPLPLVLPIGLPAPGPEGDTL